MATAKKSEHSDIKNFSFEEALTELEAIVKRLESGKETLETAIEDYTRGSALKEHCAKKLSEARLKVEKIIANGDGSVSTEKADYAD
jgi:exodeoxyribonuclease VII small subunit